MVLSLWPASVLTILDGVWVCLRPPVLRDDGELLPLLQVADQVAHLLSEDEKTCCLLFVWL